MSTVIMGMTLYITVLNLLTTITEECILWCDHTLFECAGNRKCLIGRTWLKHI